MPIKVIDLFAGPGGLGEGFSAYKIKGKSPFKIAISIEKEPSAHRTLTLRSLYRQFPKNKVPEAYYEFLKGKLGKNPEDILYSLPEMRDALIHAKNEAQKITLGEDNQKKIYKKIRDAIGNDDCILIGGPPCQAYSIAGRARNLGESNKGYKPEKDHRNFLYLEYLKIIAKFQPKVFVMENVKGMLSAKVNNKLIFDSIKKDLEDPFKATKIRPDKGRAKHKYHLFSFVKPTNENLTPRDFIIRSEKYGIPQTRHRVIVLGIRDDIISQYERIPNLEENENPVTIFQAISDLPKLRSKLSKGKDNTKNWRSAIKDSLSDKLKALSKNSNVPKAVLADLHVHLSSLVSSPTQTEVHTKNLKKKVFSAKLDNELKTWYLDERMSSHVCNHETRGHIPSDLARYMYYSIYAKHMDLSPTAKNLPKELWPNHKNFWTGKFNDRFRVQRKHHSSSTVTSHISKDGHHFIHYDPSQCRSLTVREAARIQTFPDNYFFVGNRTQTYVQVGNAVPPKIAEKISHIVYKILS